MQQMTSRLNQYFLTRVVSYLTQNVPCRIQPTTSLLYVTDIERIVIYLPKFFSINTHTFLIYCYYSPTNSTAIVLEHLRFTARMGARQILVYDYNQGGEAAPYDAPILRSPSVSRIRYVSDTDTAGIRRGYVSSDFYYFRILLCIGYVYGYVWATLDTAQHIFWHIQPTNRYNPNSLSLPLSQYPTSSSRQGLGVPCSCIRQARPATPPDAADTGDPARRRRRASRLSCSSTASPPPLLHPHGLSSAVPIPPQPHSLSSASAPDYWVSPSSLPFYASTFTL